MVATHVRIVQCILPVLQARLTIFQNLLLYSSKPDNRLGACIAGGKYVFHIHNGLLKYFTHDPESIIPIQIDFKSNGKFTVPCNYFAHYKFCYKNFKFLLGIICIFQNYKNFYFIIRIL